MIILVIGCLLLSLPVSSSSLLRTGDRGEDIKEIQSMLYHLGLLENTPDGIFGPLTEQAIKEYQELVGIVVDGIVGEETKEFLERSTGLFNPLPLLRAGESSPEVLYLQADLKERGLINGLTGQMDPSTIEGVRVFQERMDLDVDGIVGPATWEALKREDTRVEEVEEREERERVETVESKLLREGDRGPMVRTLQQRLHDLQFYNGPIDGHFGVQTRLAVKLAQQFYGLSVDGIMGPATWSAIEGAEKNLPETYTVQRGDTLWNLAQRWGTSVEEIQRLNSLSNQNQIREGHSLYVPGHYQVEKRRVEDLHWNEVNLLFPVNTTAIITDVATGLSLKVQRLFGSYHADIEPLTAQDTAILRQIYNGEWSWERRAVIVHLGDVLVAGSINGFPHDSQSIYHNNFNGHICLHFRGSRLHNSGHPDSDHQQEIQFAARQVWPLSNP